MAGVNEPSAVDDVTMLERPGVLFLCVHNAGRSQMAAGFARVLGRDVVSVFSGGSAPSVEVNPVAVAAMAEVGIDIADAVPAPLTVDMIEKVDVVVTMGCGDTCPVLPGKTYVDWDLEDPAGKSIEAVRKIRDEIERRVIDLISGLAASRP